MNRRLYRCSHDRRLAGVASGMAHYFDLDPTLVRVLWILSFFFGGFGLLAYIILAIVVPLEPEVVPGTGYPIGPDGTAGIAGEAGHDHAAVDGATAAHVHTARGTGGPGLGATFVGFALILFGGLALVDNVLPAWGDGRFLWPAFILGIGALLVVTSMRRQSTDQSTDQ